MLRGERPIDLMDDAAELLSGIKKGLLENGVIDDLKAASIRFREIADRLASGKGTVGRILSEDQRVYDELAAAVHSLRLLTERLDKG